MNTVKVRMIRGNAFEQLGEMLNSSSLKIFSMILAQADDRTGIWFSSRVNREPISKKLEMSDVAVRNQIRRLAAAGFLLRPDGVLRGTYIINVKKLKIELPE